MLCHGFCLVHYVHAKARTKTHSRLNQMLDGCRLSPAQKEIMKIFLPDEDVNNYKSGIIDENTVTEKELNAFGNCNELDFKTKFNIY